MESELAERYDDVTRAGMRATPRVLAAEGRAERIRGRGSRVCEATAEEAVAGGGRGDRRVPDGACSELDTGGLYDRIRDIVGQDTAVGLLESFNARLVRRRFRLAPCPGRPRRSLREYLVVIEASAAPGIRGRPGRPSAPASAV